YEPEVATQGERATCLTVSGRWRGDAAPRIRRRIIGVGRGRRCGPADHEDLVAQHSTRQVAGWWWHRRFGCGGGGVRIIFPYRARRGEGRVITADNVNLAVERRYGWSGAHVR